MTIKNNQFAFILTNKRTYKELKEWSLPGRILRRVPTVTFMRAAQVPSRRQAVPKDRLGQTRNAKALLCIKDIIGRMDVLANSLTSAPRDLHMGPSDALAITSDVSSEAH